MEVDLNMKIQDVGLSAEFMKMQLLQAVKLKQVLTVTTFRELFL